MILRFSAFIASAALFTGLACASAPIIPVGPQAIGHQSFEFVAVNALTIEGQVDPSHMKQCQRLYNKSLPMSLIVQYHIQGIAHERVDADMLGLPMIRLNAEGVQNDLAFMSDVPKGTLGSIDRVIFQMKGSQKSASVLLKGGKGFNCGARSVVL